MFAEIDWTRPWYAAVRDTASRIDLSLPSLVEPFCQQASALALVNHAGQPLRFVPQAFLPEGTAYEEFIGTTGQVPTRDNLHDFFNALVWLTFPAIKRELNALQAAQIAQDGVGKSRGPARDAATIYDENSALLVVRDDGEGAALVDALCNHRWREAFVQRAAQFGRGAQVWLFGHALMEKLVAPYKAITAHTRVVLAGAEYWAQDEVGRRAWLDRAEAQRLAGEGLAKGSFTPLPVLGIPGWWPQQDAAFYEDETVFRAKRKPA